MEIGNLAISPSKKPNGNTRLPDATHKITVLSSKHKHPRQFAQSVKAFYLDFEVPEEIFERKSSKQTEVKPGSPTPVFIMPVVGRQTSQTRRRDKLPTSG